MERAKPGRVKAVAVGCGLAFQSHLSGYRRCANLALHGVVSSKNPELANELGVLCYPSLKAALDDPAVDAIDLTVPSHLHAEMALAAIHHNKHVLIEKPIDSNVCKARKVVEESRKRRITVSYVSQFRFSSGVEHMMEILSSDILGTLICINGILMVERADDYYLESPWRGDPQKCGGGVLLMNGIHLVDVLTYLLGTPEVIAVKLFRDPHGTHALLEDAASLILSFEYSVMTTLLMARNAGRNYPTQVEFIGRKGRAVLSEYNLVSIQLNDGKKLRRRFGKSTTAMFAAQLDDFGSALRFGTERRTAVEEGLISLETVFRAYEMGGHPICTIS